MRNVTTLALAAALAFAVGTTAPRPAAADPYLGWVIGGLAVGAGYLLLRDSGNLQHPWYYRNLQRAYHANNVCGYNAQGKWYCDHPGY